MFALRERTKIILTEIERELLPHLADCRDKGEDRGNVDSLDQQAESS